MGIRIHKVIGYGLTDIEADTEKWQITDPRFNQNGWLCGHDENKYSLDGFVEYIKTRLAQIDEEDFDHFDLRMLLHTLENVNRYDFYNYVIYDMEFGEPNVAVFIPPGAGDWQRYDDMIDYYDPVNSDENGIKNSLIPVDRPLWPYESWINIKEMPPTRLTGRQWDAFILFRNIHRDKLKDLSYIFEEIGVENEEELKTYIVPSIPPILVELIKYLEIFVDERHIYELRPMIYGYWA
jgi:hypothetical protein